MTKREKVRLDDLLLRQGLVHGKQEAFIVVTEGRVFVNSQKAVSPAQMVDADDGIEVRPEREFVGRGAYKLEAALGEWGIEVHGKVCADVGAATGGFTEVLLRHGAGKVYAIDAGRGKLDAKLRGDPRVVVMEGVNVLDLAPESIPDRQYSRDRVNIAGEGKSRPLAPAEVDLMTIDLSFTSLRRVLPVVRRWLAGEAPHQGKVGTGQGSVVALFKPQYEVRDPSLLRHGVLRDPEARMRLLEEFRAWLGENGWRELGMAESPIRGSKGNMEYLFHLAPA